MSNNQIYPTLQQNPCYVQGKQTDFSGSRKYPKASLGNRFLASLLDGLIIVGVSIPAIIFFMAGIEKSKSHNADGAAGLMLIGVLFYLIAITYSLIKDGLGQGQSWGKRSVKLMVVNLEKNTPCDKRKSFVRNIFSTSVTAIPFVGWLIEPIMVLATHDGRKLGDKAAKTQVISLKDYN